MIRKMLKQLFIKLLLLILMISAVHTSVLAVEISTPSATIEVKHIANVVERLQEKITLWFKFGTDSKIKYYKYLTDKRLAEIAYSIDNDNGDRIEETASRYQTNIGNFGNYVVAHGLVNNKQELIDMFSNHFKVLGNLRDHFPANSGWWLAIQHDVNTIKIFSDKLNNLK